MIVGIITLGIWMLLTTYDIWSIKERLDKLEEYLIEKEQTDENDD